MKLSTEAVKTNTRNIGDRVSILVLLNFMGTNLCYGGRATGEGKVRGTGRQSRLGGLADE